MELSLDLLEELASIPAWRLARHRLCGASLPETRTLRDGLDLDLGRRSGHRLMIRLVKGAYWDSEIKRAQVDGLRVSGLYAQATPMFATWPARANFWRRRMPFSRNSPPTTPTPASGPHAWRDRFHAGRYEFQCLHGMGEPLYEEVVATKLNRPCRIYAPVGTHERCLPISCAGCWRTGPTRPL